jgi:hypothetical protein
MGSDEEAIMADKPSRPGFNKPVASRAAPKPRRKSKAVDTVPMGKTVRVGGELSLEELARQAGLRLVGPRAKVGLKKIRKASGGAVLIKERDLLTLLHADGLARMPSTRGAAKIVNAAARQSPPVVSKRETALLGRINAGLSEPKARRLEALDSRRREETLTPKEHAELLNLIEESERLAVGRAEALVELARLRASTVPSLMCDLGLGFTGRG